MNRIVECVPNFSEGRRPEVIHEIIRAISSAAGVYMLDREMDADHNRAVLTFVGSPEAVADAALKAVETATRLIDLTLHQGGHPRIGATDVVPFIPIRGVTINECVDLARYVGSEIAKRFSIPVYLYEAAATRPERANLENIRRGQFEGLRAEIETNTERNPDFGDARIHPTAGATVVGARKPLIAYNINLHTADLQIAKNIAKRIRFSSGGLRYVKAMGVFLKERNQAQVSMNLTDFEQTSIELVFELVKREAERHGINVAGSEIVGLIPQRALEQAAEFYLRIENFKPSMILENRLAEAMTAGAIARGWADMLRPFVDAVASTSPAPGGGSVAALSGALGAALGLMVAGLTKEKKNYQQHEPRYGAAMERLKAIHAALLELVDTDALSFDRVVSAYKLPKDSPEREKAVQEALSYATEVPSRTASQAAEALALLNGLKDVVHPNVQSDFEVAITMLRSAVAGGLANMRINLSSIADPTVKTGYEAIVSSLEKAL